MLIGSAIAHFVRSPALRSSAGDILMKEIKSQKVAIQHDAEHPTNKGEVCATMERDSVVSHTLEVATADHYALASSVWTHIGTL